MWYTYCTECLQVSHSLVIIHDSVQSVNNSYNSGISKLSPDAGLMVFWMKSSVSMSTAVVASSSTRIFVFLNNALAKHTN